MMIYSMSNDEFFNEFNMVMSFFVLTIYALFSTEILKFTKSKHVITYPIFICTTYIILNCGLPLSSGLWYILDVIIAGGAAIIGNIIDKKQETCKGSENT